MCSKYSCVAVLVKLTENKNTDRSKTFSVFYILFLMKVSQCWPIAVETTTAWGNNIEICT